MPWGSQEKIKLKKVLLRQQAGSPSSRTANTWWNGAVLSWHWQHWEPLLSPLGIERSLKISFLWQFLASLGILGIHTHLYCSNRFRQLQEALGKNQTPPLGHGRKAISVSQHSLNGCLINVFNPRLEKVAENEWWMTLINSPNTH